MEEEIGKRSAERKMKTVKPVIVILKEEMKREREKQWWIPKTDRRTWKRQVMLDGTYLSRNFATLGPLT